MKRPKHEWRKSEKKLYLPKAIPELINIPKFNFITIKGEGAPNTDYFTQHIQALYKLAYTIKMKLKSHSSPPEDYFDFTVYPLEGVWSLNDEAIKNFTGKINKKDFVYKLMLRQPHFVDQNIFDEMYEMANLKSDNPCFEKLQFEEITEGKCIQMRHLGSFDEEPKSFAIMEEYANEIGVERLSKKHREIYLSDFRKVAEDRLKTILRFRVS